jgi:hypothetical protein
MLMKKKIPSWAVPGTVTSILSMAAGGVISVLNDHSEKEKRYQELLRFNFSEHYLRYPISKDGLGPSVSPQDRNETVATAKEKFERLVKAKSPPVVSPTNEASGR